MDIHIRNIPAQSSNAELNEFLKPLLQRLDIKEYDAAKVKNKAWGLLYIRNARLAEEFIREWNQKVKWRHRWTVHFEKSNRQDGGAKARNMKSETGKLSSQ
jgi:hypothetical protein